MNSIHIVISGICLFFTSVIGVRLFCRYAIKNGILDVPNDRSSHQEVTPRGAGVVFVLLWFFTLLTGYQLDWVSGKQLLIFLPSTALVSAIGFYDDNFELAASKRLWIQGLAAVIWLCLVGDMSGLHLFNQSAVHLGWVGLVVAFLGLVWSTNIYNFMDGLDGMAAVEALFVFGVGGLLFWQIGESNLALLAWCLVLTVAGFLVWNWPKARVFMGDVGSYCLGFLVAAFALVGDRWYHIPITLWVILYGIFWFDATVTLLRRLWLKENLAMAHREHAFHRLHRLGYSHSQVLRGVIALNCVLTGIALWASHHPLYIGWCLLLTVSILSLIYLIIEKLKPMQRINR